MQDLDASRIERFWQSALRTAKRRIAELSALLDNRDATLDGYKGRRGEKSKGQYQGPGECKVAFRASDNTLRFVIAHTLEGGHGELYHIYSEREFTFFPPAPPVATELPLFEHRQ